MTNQDKGNLPILNYENILCDMTLSTNEAFPEPLAFLDGVP